MDNSIVRPDSEEAGLQPVRIGMPFRIVAAGLVPPVWLGTGIGIYVSLLAVLDGGFSQAWQMLGMMLAMAAGGGYCGWRLLHAARTGVDPFSEDRARADAEHRAMLAALRATGEERPELPRPPRG